MNELPYFESSQDTLDAAMYGKPRASCQVVKNNICLKSMHTS